MRDLCHFGDVDDIERRIGRAFEKERLGVRPHRVAPFVKIAAVDQRRGDTEARQVILDDIAAGAEHGLRGDHVIAGLELADQRNRDGGHSGRRRARRFGALERRHAPLEHVDRRIGKAGILVARIFALEARFRLGGAVVNIALGEKQRLGGFAEGRTQRAGMDQSSFRAISLLRRMQTCGPPGQTKTRPGGISSGRAHTSPAF